MAAANLQDKLKSMSADDFGSWYRYYDQSRMDRAISDLDEALRDFVLAGYTTDDAKHREMLVGYISELLCNTTNIKP